MCEIDADANWRAWRETVRTARKHHRCDSCWRVIKPGAIYRYLSGIDDECDPFSRKTCSECAIAIDIFGQLHRFTPDPWTFLEFLDQCVDADTYEGDNEAIAMWAPIQRRLERLRKVNGERRDNGGWYRKPAPDAALDAEPGKGGTK